MKIYVDGDHCPVIPLVDAFAKQTGVSIVLVSDYHHIYDYENMDVMQCDTGKDAVDFWILSRLEKDDLVITQDDGFACLAMQKQAFVLHPNGYFYHPQNMDNILYERYMKQKIRKQTKRHSHHKKRCKQMDEQVQTLLWQWIKEVTS